MSFTATGNALVVTDSLGQLYLYRMSPISDPGGPHTVPYLVTMYEYSLVSGVDFWDLTICTKLAHIDPICDKLTENYGRQPESNKKYYQFRLNTIKSALYRLAANGEQKAADCYAQLMLNSVHGAFKSLLRTSDTTGPFLDKTTTTHENITSK